MTQNLISHDLFNSYFDPAAILINVVIFFSFLVTFEENKILSLMLALSIPAGNHSEDLSRLSKALLAD